ncbi:MAG: hypothetical protein N4A38_00820 [Candidatus Gracilibacteria bacterium]|nr:hypothetical protein [Candidatus Gracilibacteria bacterium]
MNKIGFLLGREFKLSIKEILEVFNTASVFYCDKKVLIIEGVLEEEILNKANILGGTIKIFKLNKLDNKADYIEEIIKNKGNKKYAYAINNFSKNIKNRELLIDTKKTLKEKKISSRFVNKDFKNLSSAHIIKEKLVDTKSDFNFIEVEGNYYFGETIFVQDIDAYSKRDYEKQRDMQTGMLPPKLSQMMLNLAGDKDVYDPFCGLGTVLIEAVLRGDKNTYGSDISINMVEFSIDNLEKAKREYNLDFNFEIARLNAGEIDKSDFINKKINIVTEGYLGEIMTKRGISIEKIEKQRKILSAIYKDFFSNLKKIKFDGNIIISFPFWNLKGKYCYLEEIYPILEKNCEIIRLDTPCFNASKFGSLLYIRDNQLVGREIFKLKIK